MDAVRDGTLRIVLPEYEASSSEMPTAIFAVYPDRRQLLPRTRAFIDFVAEKLSLIDIDSTISATALPK